jgi:hypothetical protein
MISFRTNVSPCLPCFGAFVLGVYLFGFIRYTTENLYQYTYDSVENKKKIAKHDGDEQAKNAKNANAKHIKLTRVPESIRLNSQKIRQRH